MIIVRSDSEEANNDDSQFIGNQILFLYASTGSIFNHTRILLFIFEFFSQEKSKCEQEGPKFAGISNVHDNSA
jgi:hypothetical protein